MLELISLVLNFLLSSGLAATLLFYRAKRRKELAEAEGAELVNEQSEIDRLEIRLKQRDDKVDALYIELRQEQAAHRITTDEKHRLQLDLEIQKIKRCDIRACGSRQPPGEY